MCGFILFYLFIYLFWCQCPVAFIPLILRCNWKASVVVLLAGFFLFRIQTVEVLTFVSHEGNAKEEDTKFVFLKHKADKMYQVG